MEGPHDPSRRTLLANERTALAWWRTGLTTMTVGLACARIVPELSDAGAQWPYTALGVVFLLLGVLCMVFGEGRRRAVDRAVRLGHFADPDPRVMTALTAVGALAGGLLVLVVVLAP